MIISHKYKFIFIKTYKTAGTSLESYLSEFCGETDVLTPVYPPVPGHLPRNVGDFYNHMPALEVQKKVGSEVWNSYFKFCVERNPWEKVLSFYWMEKTRNDSSLDLDEFLTRDNIGVNWHLYTDQEQKSPIVDRVLKYETIGHNLGQVFNTLGIPWGGTLEPKAKSGYRSDRRNYREVLSDGQSRFIAQKFSKEIEWHGYEY